MVRLRLQSLIERLDALPQAQLTVPRVQQILADGELDDAELRRFVGELLDKYARRPVHRSRNFDILVLTWAPGQYTPIHNHAGNCGWVRLVRGQIEEQTFRLVPGASVADAAVAGSVKGRTGCLGLGPAGRCVA